MTVEFANGTRGMLDLCMFAEGSKNEQEISVVGDIGKVPPFSFAPLCPNTLSPLWVLSGSLSLLEHGLISVIIHFLCQLT